MGSKLCTTGLWKDFEAHWIKYPLSMPTDLQTTVLCCTWLSLNLNFLIYSTNIIIVCINLTLYCQYRITHTDCWSRLHERLNGTLFTYFLLRNTFSGIKIDGYFMGNTFVNMFPGRGYCCTYLICRNVFSDIFLADKVCPLSNNTCN